MLSTNQRQHHHTLLGFSLPMLALLLLLVALLTINTTTTLAQEPTPTATPTALSPTSVAQKPTLPRIQLVFLTPTATPTSTETLEPPSPASPCYSPRPPRGLSAR